MARFAGSKAAFNPGPYASLLGYHSISCNFYRFSQIKGLPVLLPYELHQALWRMIRLKNGSIVLFQIFAETVHQGLCCLQSISQKVSHFVGEPWPDLTVSYLVKWSQSSMDSYEG